MASTAPGSLSPSPQKRRMSHDDLLSSEAPTKKAKTWCESSEFTQQSQCSSNEGSVTQTPNMDAVRDVIQHHFGLEILLKHQELRLIDQELAKCQIALEQLRRCHLIPYPVNCPTPDQMLDISNGKGPAVVEKVGDAVPQWAPPFGVVDGPYARHYAKWLIPDPAFDGVQPEWPYVPESRVRGSVPEGRTTRNSYMEPGHAHKGRHARAYAGQRHQALSNGTATPKEKAGPCILKRALDGQTVKLVCLDCHRDNFSSTQGFINHCRIAHKRDFKSHEEAAIACGHPIDAIASGIPTGGKDEKPTTTPTAASVHPFARADMSEQEAYVALRSRISDSLKLYHQGKLSGVSSIPAKTGTDATTTAPHATQSSHDSTFEPSQETPHLSRLLQRRRFQGSLKDCVADAKIKMPLEDLTPGEEMEDVESSLSSFDGIKDIPPARTPVVMRMPARSVKSSLPTGSAGRPTSSKGRAAHISLISPSDTDVPIISKNAALSDEDLDMEDVNLSPNTLVSNNAPSLVSDDGEYDSDEGSSVSGASDLDADADAVSDVAEISLEDEHDPRTIRRGPVKLRKDDAKHVTFIGPVRNAAKDRRARKL
ncbi:hypothetical protein PT974_11231 [Cladobotryum mycophilum]|uniref:AHC1-like C2H2 zinc-finger domain-containing protein n=1 Tax=Cladobotryum mycophilum TaxID=491253 RepID=A0ABR0S4M5_9HYPO